MLRCNSHVAGERKAAAGTGSNTVDGGNDGFFHRSNEFDPWVVSFLEICCHGGDVAWDVLGFEVTKVLSAAKGASNSGNDNNLHIVVASDVFECGDEFCADLVIEGVEYIRSIERNGGHVVRDGERDGGEVGCGCHDLFTFR